MLAFGTLVKVVAGFYLGCMGMVQTYNTTDDYSISLTCKDGIGNFSEQFVDLKLKDIRRASKKEWEKFKKEEK